MSTAVFNYKDIGQAADQARKSADCLDSYREELDKKVSRKLDAYGGRRTANVSAVFTQIRRKKEELEDKAARLRTYGKNLDGLARECKAADVRVKGRISTLCQSFAIRHDIQISASAYRDAMLGTARANGNKVSRWFSDTGDKAGDWFDDAGNRIAHWYQFEGGKYVIWENLKAALKIALGVVTVIAALASSGVVLLIAGVVAGMMMVLDGAVDVGGNIAAGVVAKDDPVRAKRVSEVDELTEFMRLSYNKDVHNAAAALDTVTLAANVVNLAAGIKNLAAKGYRWIISGNFNPSDFKWMTDFHWKDLGTGIATKLKNFSGKITDIWGNFRAGKLGLVGKELAVYGKKFLNNMYSPYDKAFKDISALNVNTPETLKDGYKGWKTVLTTAKNLFPNSASRSDVKDSFVKTLTASALAGIAVGDVGDNTLVSVKEIVQTTFVRIPKYTKDFIELTHNNPVDKVSAKTYQYMSEIRENITWRHQP